jgi:hypothetical protein
VTIRDEKRAMGMVIRMLLDHIPFSVTYGEGVVYLDDHTKDKGGTDEKQAR